MKKIPTTIKDVIKVKSCEECIQVIQQDNQCIKEGIAVFSNEFKEINTNTKEVADTLKQMHENETVVAATLKEMHKDNNKHLEIIAGKKQIPLSAFLIIISVMCGLLLVSEVKNKGINVEFSSSGIKIITQK